MTRKKRRKTAEGAGDSGSNDPRTGKPPSSGLFGLPALDAQPLGQSWPHLLVVFALLMAVYAATAPPTVVLEDDGEFIMAVYFLGVAHPPGYPLYVLLAHPFTWLPFGSVAYRVHLASGFFAAAACAALWWSVRAIVPRRDVAYVTALAFGFSEAFWSQAIIAEVYALNVLVFTLMLATCISYLQSPRPRPLAFLSLLLGLGLSNHWPLLVLALPALLLLLWPARRSILAHLPRVAPYAVPLFIAGLAPYAWMVVRSQTATSATFAGAMETWDELVYYVSRGPYSDSSRTAGAWDKLQYGFFLLKAAIAQFTPVGAAVVAIGMVTQWRTRRPLTLGLWAAFLVTPVALILLRNVDYQLSGQAVTRVYPLVPYMALAIWLGMGFEAVNGWLRAKKSRLGMAAAGGVGVLLVLVTLLVNLGPNDRRHYDFARDYGSTLLSSFDADATVFMLSDFSTLSMQYLHFVEGARPDVRLYHMNGLSLALDGRLLHQRVAADQALDERERDELILQFIQDNDGPIYFMEDAPGSISDIDYGLYKKIDRSVEDRTTWTIDRGLFTFFLRTLADTVSSDAVDLWARDFVIGKMVPVVTALVEVPPVSPSAAERWGPALEEATNTLPGLLARVGVLGQRGGATDEEILELLEQREDLTRQAVSKAQRARYYLLRGRMLKRLGRLDEAYADLQKSATIFPHPNNAAVNERKRVYVPDDEASPPDSAAGGG